MARTATTTIRAAAIALFGTGALLVPDAEGAGPSTERVNVRPDGGQSNQPGGGLFPSVSLHGDRVVFTSRASNMLKGDKDAGGTYQVYMRNRAAAKNVLISVNNHGDPANGNSFFPLISANGQAVVFMSEATNLVPNDDNGHQDVFIRNLKTGKTILVTDARGKTRHSANNDSYQPAGISSDGKVVTFISAATNLVKDVTDTNHVEDVFHWSYFVDKAGLHTKTKLVSHGAGTPLRTANGVSGGLLGGGDRGNAALSGDGNCVAFGSRATNLTSDEDANDAEVDVFLSCGYLAGPIPPNHKVSVSTDGEQGDHASYAPSLNLSGSRVGFYSTSTNLLGYNTYVNPPISNDTNNAADIFVVQVDNHQTPISVDRANLSGADTEDTAGAVPLGSQALSSSGTKVAFATFGRLAGPTDCTGEQVYLRNTATKTTTLVSVMTNGHCGDRFSNYTNISRDGSWVVWTGAASKLVAGDTNNDQDEFIRGPF